MGQQVFYRADRVLAPSPNQRGRKTLQYVIVVNTHDHEGNELGRLRDRAKETFNLLPSRITNDPVDLVEIDEKDVPKDKLEKVLMRHDGALYLIKDD